MCDEIEKPKNRFKIGDIVQLKSGGPKMTVSEATVSYVERIPAVTGIWFTKNDERRIGAFPEEMLGLVSNNN